MNYKVADIIVDIEFNYKYGVKRMSDYRYEGDRPSDFSVRVTQQEIEESMKRCNDNFPASYHEWMCVYRSLCIKALDYDCLFMHCSAVCLDSQAYLFIAASGTGKSTHASFWRECFGDRVVMINDDKPLLRYVDGKFYVYGTPWDGKHHLSTNTRAPVKALCILYRNDENVIERASVGEANFMILNQTVRPENAEKMEKTLYLAGKLLESEPCYKLGCNMSVQAAEVAYKGMNENED